jgi:hypothetical protein
MKDVTDYAWAKHGDPGKPWPWPNVRLVTTPVSDSDLRVAAEIREQIDVRSVRP